MEAADKMSYEYILKSNEKPCVLYDRINHIIKNTLTYAVSFENDKAVGYKIPWVENSWGADVEVFISKDGVGLNIIIGNVKEIINAIENEVYSNQINFTVEEI